MPTKRIPGETACTGCGGQLVEDLGHEGMICVDDACPKYLPPSWRCTSGNAVTCVGEVTISGYYQRCVHHLREVG